MKATKLLLALVLSFSVVSMTFGYAQLTSLMHVNVTSNAAPQDGVFILDVTEQEANNATGEILGYAQCALNTRISLGATAAASLTYTVEFYNNGTKDLAYIQALHDEIAYDNNAITYTITGAAEGDVIAKGGRLSLALTFSYRDTVSANRILNAVLSFRFGEVVIFNDVPGQFEPGENYKTLIARILTNSNRYGLNDSHKGYVIHNALEEYGTLYSIDNVSGGNINKVLSALQSATANIDFVFEYVSATEYVVYLFSRTEATVGNTATVYKQHLHYKDGKWAEDPIALVGTAPIKEVDRPKGTAVSILPEDWVPSTKSIADLQE